MRYLNQGILGLAVAGALATATLAPAPAEARVRGGAIAAGVIGGLALGALASQSYGYYPGYAYGPSYYYATPRYAEQYYYAPPARSYGFASQNYYYGYGGGRRHTWGGNAY